MRQTLRACLLLFSVATLTGCASTMTASSHVRHGLDLTRYQTFDWAPADELPKGDRLIEQHPFFMDHVRGVVERELASRSIVLSRTSPDLLLHVHSRLDHKIDIPRTERDFEYCQTSDCDDWLIQYQAGTLILDVVDARTSELLWRGWAQDTVDGVLGHQTRMAAKLQDKVQLIMARFPKRL